MRRFGGVLVFFTCCAALAAADQRSKPQGFNNDLCEAPAYSVAPSLPARLMPGQGKVHMKITARSEMAQKFFDQGLAMMGNFWTREAERSFLQAAQLDPEAPMPQWGIAMVAGGEFRPAFQLMDDSGSSPLPPVAEMKQFFSVPAVAGMKSGLERAYDAALKAQQLKARGTHREQLYVAAVAARWNSNSQDTDSDYLEALYRITQEFPDDVEAKTFLALGLMSGYSRPDRKPLPGTENALALLTEALKRDPSHPGANHYWMHGIEGSGREKEAFASCELYPKLAPENPHALHMPGHIYFQTGRFADAAQAFEAAAQKERQYMARDQLYPTVHHGHNLHFLATTYCFLGDYSKAMAVSGELLRIRESPREAKDPFNIASAHRQGWFARMRTLVRFEKWDEILGSQELPEYPQPFERAWLHWARGLAYTAKGNSLQAKGELKALEDQMTAWKRDAGAENGYLRAARVELIGHVEMRFGDRDRGLETLARAGDMEDRLRYSEPPTYPRPVWDAMGQEALNTHDWARAETAFRNALRSIPGDPYAKAGLAAAQAHNEKALAALKP